MRTTLSIDDDVLEAVKERARREDRTAGEVISDLARTALTQRMSGRHTAKNGFAVLAPRGRTVTNSLVERLRDEDGS
ncbi:MAG: ribbon-helix-helix domain-containing protein [Tetrasphaera jenkinsii]|jgi:metal-responsive CopG/Arc/MetJ family transcriptional regulator|nr:ribbon-helix-helix domain-containing protein [Tetrasphaera jenkinsii]